METTSVLQKLIPSIINVSIVFLLASPFLFMKLPLAKKRLILIGLFLLYNLFFLIFFDSRDIGMMIVKTYWKDSYPIINQLIYAILYTGSFATLVCWIRYPFDLFIFNMLCLQLPCILLTGTTLHGHLSGNMVTIIMGVK